MRITDISNMGNRIYSVTFTPNLIGRWLGRQPNVINYKDSGRYYKFGGDTIYIRQDGAETDPGSIVGEAIDKKRRSW